MTEFRVGDKVRVELPRGYSKRGVLGISVMYTTSPEARFEGAIGDVTQINPAGLHSVHQYLVDFRPYDNSRLGIPWQAQWFREEWLAPEHISGDEPAVRKPASRAGAEGSASPVAAGTSPGGDDRTPGQEAQERARLSSSSG
jgi:hypothetical protein